MKSDDVNRTLAAIEQSFQEDSTANVAGTGFWKVVAAAKQDPKLVLYERKAKNHGGSRRSAR